MPRIAIDCGDSYDSVIRPTVLSVVEKVKKVTGLSKVKTLFTGDPDNTPQIGNSLNGKESDVSFTNEEYLQLEVRTQYMDGDMLTNTVFARGNIPIFKDPELGVVISPVYGQTQVTISVKYKAQSRNSAERWLSEVKRRTAQGFKELLHESEYHYLIPKEMLVILDQIHQRREAVAGYGEDLGTYLNKYWHPKVTWLANQSGMRKAPGVRERQHDILGYFDFESVPELEKGETGNWIRQFDYIVQFDRPHSVVMQYPLVVHNQLLEARYFDANQNFNLNLEMYLSTAFNQGLDVIANRHRLPALSTIMGYSVPAFDEWLPSSVPMGTSTMARILLAVDADNPRYLCNIEELGEFALIDEVVTYLKDRAAFATKVKSSPVFFSLYQDDTRMSDSVLEMDDQGNLFTTIDLSLRRVYHLRVGVYNDLSLLNEDSLEDIRLNGEFARILLSALEPKLKDDPLLNLLDDGRLPKRQFWDAVAKIKGTNAQYKNNIEVSRFTVASLMLTANRPTQYA